MQDSIMSEPALPSGRFVLRLSPALHARLVQSARARGLSLNEHCVQSLARAEALDAGAFGAVIAQAIEQCGSALLGVAVFGSFARGEAGPGSDVDVLLVVNGEVEVTRALYAPWDEVDRVIDGHRVEPHFVQARTPSEPISGFWAEVALDAAVIHDPDLALARDLGRIRRAILGGTMVRRSAGGRSWWTAA
ncbi:hypothetical protein BH23GEM9_BH23GEM9_36350 [soil metagenome]